MHRGASMSFVVLIALTGIGAAALPAQDDAAVNPDQPLLAVGDSAPALVVEKYLKGDPIAAFEPGHVYVVEFWATWCAPCIEAMPHLSELQAEYADRGVTIIGINIREMVPDGQVYRESFTEETRAEVESFVREQGDLMAYTVAYDGATKKMDRALMKASGDRGMPATFIVDREGTIAWIGHPMVLRMPLHEIAEGTWDMKTGPERVQEAEDVYIGAMRMFATDGEAGLAAWDRAAEEYPILVNDLIGPKYQALLAAGQCDAAYAACEVLVAEAIEIGDPSALNSLAWSIVNPNATLATRDLDLALRAANAANEFTDANDPGILDTLARVHFVMGDIEKAIELQTRAVELADEQMKLRLAPALEEYKKATH